LFCRFGIKHAIVPSSPSFLYCHPVLILPTHSCSSLQLLVNWPVAPNDASGHSNDPEACPVVVTMILGWHQLVPTLNIMGHPSTIPRHHLASRQFREMMIPFPHLRKRYDLPHPNEPAMCGATTGHGLSLSPTDSTYLAKASLFSGDVQSADLTHSYDSPPQIHPQDLSPEPSDSCFKFIRQLPESTRHRTSSHFPKRLAGNVGETAQSSPPSPSDATHSAEASLCSDDARSVDSARSRVRERAPSA
jgi:hypothetical protein